MAAGLVIVRRADFTARVAPPIRDEAVRADDWAVGAFRSGPSEGIFTWSWRVIRTMRGTSSRSGYDRFAQALSMLLLMNIFSRQQHVGKVCWADLCTMHGFAHLPRHLALWRFCHRWGALWLLWQILHRRSPPEPPLFNRREGGCLAIRPRASGIRFRCQPLRVRLKNWRRHVRARTGPSWWHGWGRA